MGSRWTSFYTLGGWSHQSWGVCVSPSRLRTPWCLVVCLIHCCVPQGCSATINTMGVSSCWTTEPWVMCIFGYPAGQLSRVFHVSSATFILTQDLPWHRWVFVSSKRTLGLESFQSWTQRTCFLVVKFQKSHCWCRKRILEYHIVCFYLCATICL